MVYLDCRCITLVDENSRSICEVCRSGMGHMANCLNCVAKQYNHLQLTNDEMALVDMLASWWNGFTSLPHQHPNDTEEAAPLVHALQRLVMARLTRRAYPETFLSNGQVLPKSRL